MNNSKRKIVITIDTEAHTVRAEKNHIDRLIWGKWGRGPGFGIPLMMNIADTYGIKLTHFLELCGYSTYGESLLDVGREIVKRGHDLQAHMHPELSSNEFFAYHALRNEKGNGWSPSDSSSVHIHKYIDFMLDTYGKITLETPYAYRSIGYKLTPDLIDILGETHIPISCNYNAAFPDRIPFLSGLKKPFHWHTGMLELPVSCIKRKNGIRIEQYNFNTSALLHGSVEQSVLNHKIFLDNFYKHNGEDAIAVMVMHSWSFFTMDANGYFTIRNDDAIRKFDAILKDLSQSMEFITLKEVALNRDILFKNVDVQPPLSEQESAFYSYTTTSSPYVCPLCNTSVDKFVDLFGGHRRQCPVCHAIERQRVFYRLYSKNVFGPALFAGKKILHIAPSIPERKMFKDLLGVLVVTADIRPEVKPDMILDITKMAGIPDESFDVVFCSFVFTCTHFVHKAIREIHRILKIGGVLLCHDPLAKGKDTVEHDEKSRITAHYGEEAFTAYDIGSFRQFGENDYISYFSDLFDTRLFMETDIPTGMPVHWLKGTKLSAQEPHAPTADAEEA